jgi:hypothetical protein
LKNRKGELIAGSNLREEMEASRIAQVDLLEQIGLFESVQFAAFGE